MTGSELKRLYANAFGHEASEWDGRSTLCHDKGLLAVYERGRRDGATQQRDMEPTPAMIDAAYNRHMAGDDHVAEGGAGYALWQETIRAAMRAAPLATDAKK